MKLPDGSEWPPRRHKYNAVPTVVDGVRFASKREATRYMILKHLEREGKIHSLQLQPRFQLRVNGELICTYVADFRYEQGASVIIEDAKGVKTAAYLLKKKLLHACFGITIREV